MRLIVALSLLALAANAQFSQECTNVPDGLYPLGACEPNFLTCSGGIARVMDCPADLIYNEVGQICDWQYNVVGCGGSNDAYRTTSNEQYGEASGEASGYIANDPSVEASGNAYEYTSTAVTTEVPAESYEDASTTTVASDVPVAVEDYTSTVDSTTVGNYGETTEPTEEYSRLGSDEATVANDVEDASTEANTVSEPETLPNVCENLEDGVYSDGSCTTLYHICKSNVARFVNCPTPLFYDAASEKCNWGTHIEACQGHVAVHNSPFAGEQSGDGSGDLEPTCDGKADGIYPIEVCSTDFLTCTGGIARVMNCPSSLVFNPSLHVCDWARDVAECSGLPKPPTVCEEDGYFSFGQCSSSFTACTNGRAIVMFCPAGLKFSGATQRCGYAADVSECQSSSGRSADAASATPSGAYGQQSDEPATTPVASYERYSNEESTTYSAPSNDEPATTTTVAASETYAAPSNDEPATTTVASYENASYEESTTPAAEEVYASPTNEEPTTTSTAATTTYGSETYPEPASDKPETTTTTTAATTTYGEIYAEPTTEEPASDEPLTTTTTTTTTTAYGETYATPASEEPVTTVSATTSTETYAAPSYEEPVTSTAASYEKASDEGSAYAEVSNEEPVTTPVAPYGKASDEGSGDAQNSCTGLEDGLYSVGCSPSVLSCQHGHEDNFECPPNLVFNEETSICDYPQTSLKCQFNDAPIVDNTPVTPFDCSSDGLFSDALCSASYHQCSAGHLINFTCADANAVFSVADASCVDSSNLPQCQSLSSPY